MLTARIARSRLRCRARSAGATGQSAKRIAVGLNPTEWQSFSVNSRVYATAASGYLAFSMKALPTLFLKVYRLPNSTLSNRSRKQRSVLAQHPKGPARIVGELIFKQMGVKRGGIDKVLFRIFGDAMGVPWSLRWLEYVALTWGDGRTKFWGMENVKRSIVAPPGQYQCQHSCQQINPRASDARYAHSRNQFLKCPNLA